jgi:putative membrane protein
VRTQIYHVLNNRIARTILFVGISSALLSSCKKDDTTSPGTANSNAVDVAFLSKASLSNLAEIELGKLTQTNGGDTMVKNFGTLTVHEHTLAQTELVSLASSKSTSIPLEIDSAHKAMKAKLSTLSGAKFDTAYIHGQIIDHTKTSTDFQTEISQGTDQDIKAYANRYLPHVTIHLQKADTIMVKLKSK